MPEEEYKVDNFLKLKGLSQDELAKKADVSQPTVSRNRYANPEKFVRCGGARQKLLTYIEMETQEKVEVDSESPRMKVVAAFDQIWDKSEAHADAVVKVIKSLVDLRPKKPKRGE